MLVELLAVLIRGPASTVGRMQIEGLEHLRSVMDRHGRALLLTAHLGNWELLPFACQLTGYRLSVVLRPLDARWLDRLVLRLRGSAEVELIDKHSALRPVVRALGEGRMVGVLLDQNAARREGVFVPFFGHPASTSKSLALLALRTDAPIVPAFIRRLGDGTHRVVVRPALASPDERPFDVAVQTLTARCTEAIEQAIREAPAQWLWLHDRWRTRPAKVSDRDG